MLVRLLLPLAAVRGYLFVPRGAPAQKSGGRAAAQTSNAPVPVAYTQGAARSFRTRAPEGPSFMPVAALGGSAVVATLAVSGETQAKLADLYKQLESAERQAGMLQNPGSAPPPVVPPVPAAAVPQAPPAVDVPDVDLSAAFSGAGEAVSNFVKAAGEMVFPLAFVAANVLGLLWLKNWFENSMDAKLEGEMPEWRREAPPPEPPAWKQWFEEQQREWSVNKEDMKFDAAMPLIPQMMESDRAAARPPSSAASADGRRSAPTIFFQGISNLTKEPLGWLEARPPLGNGRRAAGATDFAGSVRPTQQYSSREHGELPPEVIATAKRLYEEELRLAQGLSALPRSSGSEEEAKRAWLARQNAPTWGQQAETLSGVAAVAATAEQTAAACNAGDYAACDNLSREEEAKKAYLAQLDAPTLEAAAAAVSAVAVKQTQSAVQMNDLAAACDNGDNVACDNLSREEEARRAYLAGQAVSEDDAKRAWLAQVDAPTWGRTATTFVDAASEAAASAEATAAMTAACYSGDEVACDNLSAEQEAKLAWLAKLDAPTWGAAAAAVSVIADEKKQTY